MTVHIWGQTPQKEIPAGKGGGKKEELTDSFYTQTQPDVKSYSTTTPELIAAQFPPRPKILEPILARQGLAMLHGWRGTGKTFAALSIAFAAAGYGMALGRWSYVNPVRVLYLDGELPGQLLQERVTAISPAEPGECNDLFFLTQDTLNADLMPNLAIRKGREAVEHEIKQLGIGLLVVDSLATLYRVDGDIYHENNWHPWRDWLLRLRHSGVSVLAVHHDGKDGSQRGNSSKEDILDTVIHLRRAQDALDEDGARVEVHFTKARDFYGEAAKPFLAELTEAENGKLEWKSKDITNELDEVRELKEKNMSVRQIAKELNLHKSKVQRLLNKI